MANMGSQEREIQVASELGRLTSIVESMRSELAELRQDMKSLAQFRSYILGACMVLSATMSIAVTLALFFMGK